MEKNTRRRHNMPFIHVRAYSGRDEATKKKAAQAIMKAASEAMGTPETAFTVAFEDVEKEAWEQQVQIPVMEPLKDKILIDHGKQV
jgi:phenylpyruvate tautomerase PptA (4-oxalocrotonate tautomerase family)